MDKKDIGLVALCVLLLLFFNPILDFFWPHKPAPVRPTQITNQVNNASVSPSPTATTGSTSIPTPPTLLGNASTSPQVEAKIVTLENDKVLFEFTNIGGGIQQAILKKYSEHGENITINTRSPLPILDSELAGISFLQPYEITTLAPNRIQATTQSSNLQISKEYTLQTNYQIEVKLTLRNLGKEPITNTSLRISLGMIRPINEPDLNEFVGLTFYSNNKPVHEKFSGIQKETLNQGKPYQRDQPVEWAALRSQYFTTLLTPTTPFAGVQAQHHEIPLSENLKLKDKFPLKGLVGTILSQPVNLPPDGSLSWTFSLFSGPKEHEVLSSMGKGQDEVLDLGFFGLFSNALLWLMAFFHKYLNNWGFAIVAVTVVLKIVFWPLTAISTRSMKQMQALSPMVNELKEKHKENPQKMNEEMMKLYKDYKINPLAGCLPMLVQIPIFIGFYNMLRVAVELRGAPFVLWIQDLSQPDTVAYIPGLNFPINPLPLIMAATQIWQMRITPQAPNTDPAMKMVMWLMPAMFLFICYNFSSGLSLYWTVQNLLTIAQTFYTKDQPVAPPQKVKRKGGFTFNRPRK